MAGSTGMLQVAMPMMTQIKKELAVLKAVLAQKVIFFMKCSPNSVSILRYLPTLCLVAHPPPPAI